MIMVDLLQPHYITACKARRDAGRVERRLEGRDYMNSEDIPENPNVRRLIFMCTVVNN